MLSMSARASFGSITGVLPTFTDMRRAAHRSGRVRRNDLTRHQPIEQMAQRRELRLDGRGRVLLLLHLDPGGDVKRLHGLDRSHLSSHHARNSATARP